MRVRVVMVLAACLAVPVGSRTAAQTADPQWPCIQRRVPELSVGQMWPGPPSAEDGAEDPQLAAMARNLAPRRVSVEDITADAADALETVPPDARPAWLADLFAAILESINAERGDLIAGIGRYAARQQSLAERIEAMETELAALQQAPEAGRDLDRIEELQDSLAWETRIFKDRAQSLTYVCEAPVLLEQRAFAIGRALSGLM
jgi:hypothetical protein